MTRRTYPFLAVLLTSTACPQPEHPSRKTVDTGTMNIAPPGMADAEPNKDPVVAGPPAPDAGSIPADGPEADGPTGSADAAMAPPPGCARGLRDSPYGGRCRCDQDCEALASCSPEADDGVPGGYCFRFCSRDSDCSNARYSCLLIEPGKGACQEKCQRTSDCPTGRYCNSDTNFCDPLCAGNDECESGVCDPYRALCRTPGSGGTAVKGLMAPCARDDECRSGLCHPLSRRCTTSCRGSRPFCPENGVCKISTPGGDAGLCFPPCLTGGSCADRTLQCATFPNGTRACALENATMCLGAATQPGYAGNCSCPADCPQDAECQLEDSLGNPKGFCLRRCTPGSTECGPGSSCSKGGGCERVCGKDSDCPDGDLCSVVLKSCINVCQSDAQCLNGKCNLNTGFCQARIPFGNPAGAAIGAVCTKNNDCRSGRCWLFQPGAGVCITFCDTHRQVCPDGALCTDDGDGDSIGWCLKPCITNAQCVQTQTRCVPAGATGVCKPF